MKQVQVLGANCAKCDQLKQNAQEAVANSGVEATVEKITDINVLMQYGVLTPPALVVDGDVKLVGKVASPEEIAELLR